VGNRLNRGRVLQARPPPAVLCFPPAPSKPGHGTRPFFFSGWVHTASRRSTGGWVQVVPADGQAGGWVHTPDSSPRFHRSIEFRAMRACASRARALLCCGATPPHVREDEVLASTSPSMSLVRAPPAPRHVATLQCGVVQA
jgi:hypothetical protein